MTSSKINKLAILGMIVFLVVSCDYYDNFYTRIKRYQDSIKLDTDFERIDSTTFDIKTYFSLFDRLVFDSSYNYSIDYIHMRHSVSPYYHAIPKYSDLKIHRVKQYPYFIISDTLPSIIESHDIQNDYNKYLIETRKNDSVYQLLKVRPIDNLDKKNYFQLLIFHIEKDNFCRFGNSNFGNTQLVFTKKDIEKILNSPRYGGYPFTSKQKNEALKIDYNPVVLLKNNFCYIDIVSFNDWLGFYRLHYKITTKKPYEITLVESELLVEYDIGIMF